MRADAQTFSESGLRAASRERERRGADTSAVMRCSSCGGGSVRGQNPNLRTDAIHGGRSSCETDWVEKHPAHECAAWLGHSPAIAAAYYLQARNHHFEAVVNVGRKSDAESDAATAQNATQQAPARSYKESQDGTETDRSPRVITVLPNKTKVVYKRTVGPVGLEPTTKGL
jgi:hypothetical protein